MTIDEYNEQGGKQEKLIIQYNPLGNKAIEELLKEYETKVNLGKRNFKGKITE